MADKYKETPIGKIPEDWEVVRLGDIAELIMGQAPPSSTYNDKGIGLPFLQGKMEFGVIYPSPVLYCSKPIKTAEKGDILISVRAPVGDVNISPSKLCIGRGLAAIRFRKEIAYNWFYFYYFQKIKKILESIGKGSTFKAITKDDLENLNIPFPPFQEQRKIAEILSTVDKAIEKTDEIIAKTERLKKGLMHVLLTGRVRIKVEDGEIRFYRETNFKDTEIGKVPEDWEVVRLEEIAKLESGGTPSRQKPEYWTDGTIPWVKSGELNDGVIYDTEEKITELGLRNSSAKLFPKGSLLMALYGRGTVSKTAILGVDAATNQAVCAIISKKDSFIPKFMQYYLIFRRKEILGQLVNPSSDVGRTNIYISSLSLLKISLPPLEEQQKIAEILSTIDKELELERKRKEKLERIKKGLMDVLLTGKVRVRLK